MPHPAQLPLVPRLLPGLPVVPAGRRVIGVLPGEGIGPEVIAPCLGLLGTITARTGLDFDVRTGGAIGRDAERATGRALTAEVTRFCADVFTAGGALFCGPGGGRFVYDLRATFQLFCKLVPLRPLPALRGTGVLNADAVRGVDILVVRDNAGGLYQGEAGTETVAGRTRAWHRFHYDADVVERLLTVAARAAALRRGQLCVVTKPAGVPAVSTLWQTVAERVAAAAGVALECLEVDNAAYQLVADARRFDVVAAPNLFGDVLADGASLLLGSRGLSFSANYSPTGCAVYQTGHGAAHDLAGRDRANPGGQIQSLAMLLRESFGLIAVADAIDAALNDVLAAGIRTADVALPGSRPVGTREFGAQVADALGGRLRPVDAARPRTVAAGER